MLTTHSKTLSPQPANASAGTGVVKSGQDDLLAFNLRDTLSGISVREANFGEFLAAMKQRGLLAGRP